jgi:SAM-dependent methyltransferase
MWACQARPKTAGRKRAAIASLTCRTAVTYYLSPMDSPSPLARPAVPRKFFMSLRDFAFWFHSARADSLLKKIRREQGDQQAFEHLYQSLRDPWSTTVPYYRYQLRKYHIMLSLLPLRPYRRALDIGCGLGVFARELASHADQVLGVDFSRHAVDRAAELSAGVANTRFKQADLLKIAELGEGQFDLVVLADTLYYLSPLSDEMFKSVRRQVVDLLAPGGTLLLVNHFYFRFDRLSRVSRDIHECFRWAPELSLLGEHRRPFYLVSVLERNETPG